MKKIGFILTFILLSFSGFSQEYQEETGLFIGKLEINPSLSILKENPIRSKSNFTLTEVDFSQKREEPRVNMLAIMEAEKRFEQRKTEYTEPLWAKSQKKDKVFQISNHIGIYSDNANYNPYTGKVLNPAFEEARTKSFTERFSPFYSPGYYGARPRYSPFLR